MAQILQVRSLEGFHPEVGRWLWAMEDVRRRTIQLTEELDQRTIDWEGQGERENSIGSLLYHIGLVEMSWLFLDILEQEFPSDIAAAFPYEMATTGRMTRVLGVPAAEHVERLRSSRATFLTAFREMSIGDWDRLRSPRSVDYQVTPAWAVFHLLAHEAGHASQISALKARAPSSS